jgi:cell division protein ZapA
MDRGAVITVEILGREYKIRGNGDERYLRRVVSYVKERIGKVRESASLGTNEAVAILACLDIADELFREKERHEATLDTVESRSRSMVEAIDRKLAAGRS